MGKAASAIDPITGNVIVTGSTSNLRGVFVIKVGFERPTNLPAAIRRVARATPHRVGRLAAIVRKCTIGGCCRGYGSSWERLHCRIHQHQRFSSDHQRAAGSRVPLSRSYNQHGIDRHHWISCSRRQLRHEANPGWQGFLFDIRGWLLRWDRPTSIAVVRSGKRIDHGAKPIRLIIRLSPLSRPRPRIANSHRLYRRSIRAAPR